MAHHQTMDKTNLINSKVCSVDQRNVEYVYYFEIFIFFSNIGSDPVNGPHGAGYDPSNFYI